METSLRTGFAQIFSRCPKNLSCPKFGGAAAPLAPPARTPMYSKHDPIIKRRFRKPENTKEHIKKDSNRYFVKKTLNLSQI